MMAVPVISTIVTGTKSTAPMNRCNCHKVWLPRLVNGLKNLTDKARRKLPLRGHQRIKPVLMRTRLNKPKIPRISLPSSLSAK